jgi:hypothetical protein
MSPAIQESVFYSLCLKSLYGEQANHRYEVQKHIQSAVADSIPVGCD